ncbi:MAG: PilZ domain-containing protein [Steroidobacteraceae bacterium]
MEHRCGDRHPANLPVRLFLSPQEVLLGRVRDISLSGAFVQTWRELPSLSRVFVELRRVNAAGRATRQRIPAYIVRNAATGVGIEWADFAPASVREHWTAVARDAPETSRTARRRRATERRILLGEDWLVYYPTPARPLPQNSAAQRYLPIVPPNRSE